MTVSRILVDRDAIAWNAHHADQPQRPFLRICLDDEPDILCHLIDLLSGEVVHCPDGKGTLGWSDSTLGHTGSHVWIEWHGAWDAYDQSKRMVAHCDGCVVWRYDAP